MIGVEDEKVEEVISLIKQECGQHQKLTVNMPYISGTAMVNYATMPMTVEVGGATIFVINVDHYEKDLTGDFWETCLHLIQNNEKYEKKCKISLNSACFRWGLRI